jgi:glycosyltransferase involved in cell wall biosynthesis
MIVPLFNSDETGLAMRIVYLLTSLGMGGAERQALAVASRMQRRGHSVALLVLKGHVAEEWPTSLPTVHLNMQRTPWSLLRCLLNGCKFLRESRPELIHSHCFHANLVARLLRVYVSSPRLLCTIHNVYEGGWHRMLLYRLTDPLATFTTAVSGAAKQSFVRCKAVPEEKCGVVFNGIDTEEFAPCSQRRAAKRTEMLVSREFVWLAAGRIAPAKDLANLLRAFAMVRPSWPEARLWIAGTGEDAELKKGHALVQGLGLSDSICWLGLRRDLAGLMDAADGFVLASAWEGMPLVVGEAMAMEKPVVATDAGGVQELTGDSAFVVPTRDAHALAEAMLTAMRMSAEERSALGRSARARILGIFGMEPKTLEWEELYETLLVQNPC